MRAPSLPVFLLVAGSAVGLAYGGQQLGDVRASYVREAREADRLRQETARLAASVRQLESQAAALRDENAYLEDEIDDLQGEVDQEVSYREGVEDALAECEYYLY